MAGGGSRDVTGSDPDDDSDVKVSDRGRDRSNGYVMSGGGGSEKPGGSGGNGGGSRERPDSPVAKILFRKDLISAMKLPDSEPLTADDYWVVADSWKQEWEQEVQVPYNLKKVPTPHVSRLANPPHSTDRFTL